MSLFLKNLENFVSLKDRLCIAFRFLNPFPLLVLAASPDALGLVLQFGCLQIRVIIIVDNRALGNQASFSFLYLENFRAGLKWCEVMRSK